VIAFDSADFHGHSLPLQRRAGAPNTLPGGDDAAS